MSHTTPHTTANLPAQEKLLRLPEVEEAVGLKKSKIYQLIQENKFPKPIKLGARSVRWKLSSVQIFIESLSAENMEVA